MKILFRYNRRKKTQQQITLTKRTQQCPSFCLFVCLTSSFWVFVFISKESKNNRKAIETTDEKTTCIKNALQILNKWKN